MDAKNRPVSDRIGGACPTGAIEASELRPSLTHPERGGQPSAVKIGSIRALPLATAMLAAAASTYACSKIEAREGGVAETPAPAQAGPVQGRLVTIDAGDSGFSPATIPARTGETLTLRFTRTTKSECLKAIELPDLGIKKDLPMNTPVDVVIKAEKEGPIVFQCWMKMIFGKVVVSAS
jgi:hypothetical protein